MTFNEHTHAKKKKVHHNFQFEKKKEKFEGELQFVHKQLQLNFMAVPRR